MPEKEKSLDPLNDIYDDISDSEDSQGEETAMKSGFGGIKSGFGSLMSGVSQVGVTRRLPRPKTAEPSFTGRLTLDKVNLMASNPRMQASGSRILKEILVARSRAESAGMTRHDDASGKVWGALKKRISAVALSDPRARYVIVE